MDRKPHPSGRPRAQPKPVKGRPIWRVPDEGPVTPSLRKQILQPAIGFTVGGYRSQDDDES